MVNAGASPIEPSESRKQRLELSPAEFAASLTEEECMLVVMRDDLYESSWERMERDLRNRLNGRPYIFKLVNKIEADLATIAFFRCYEEKHAVDIGAILGEEP